MKTKFAVIFGLFLVEAVKCGHSEHNMQRSKESPSFVSGGSLDEMISQLSQTEVEENIQSKPNEAEAYQQPFLASGPQDPRYNPERSQDIALNVLNLSQQLIELIVSESDRKFEIVSPISIASALQLTLLGSHGMTFTELMNLMDYNVKTYSQNPNEIHEEFGLLLDDMISNSPDPSRYRPQVPWRQNASESYLRRAMKHQSNQLNFDEHKISVANGVFVRRDFSIRDEYKEAVQGIYKSEIHSLDFRGDPVNSAKFINDWVNEKTNGKIKEIIPGSTNPDTRVILANALYFKAEWQETFIEGATGFKNFYPEGRASNKSVTVELMAHGGKFPHYYDIESDCEILGFPYKQNGTTMYVILPKDSSTEKVKKLQKILTAEKIESMINKMTIKTAVVLFPKMHLTSGHHLKALLKTMGLDTLFDPQQSDLAVMSTGLNVDTQSPITNRFVTTDSPPKLQSDDRVSFTNEESPERSFERPKRDVTYKVESDSKSSSPLTFKDFFLRKKLVKKSLGKKLKRSKRLANPLYGARLEAIRLRKNLVNPYLFADDVIHKVDLTINEKGTEGGAATAISLNRSGTNVVFRVDVPFMFLIRHDPTHVSLFYGVVFQPEN